MNHLSSADHRASPPRIEIPANYNAAVDLIGRNLAAGRADKVAFVDDAGSCTYGELARRVDLFASGLAALGLRREERVMICMHDSIDWPVAFLGAIKAGVVPVAANTLLMAKDYEFMVRDSRARVGFADGHEDDTDVVLVALVEVLQTWRGGFGDGAGE